MHDKHEYLQLPEIKKNFLKKSEIFNVWKVGNQMKMFYVTFNPKEYFDMGSSLDGNKSNITNMSNFTYI